MASPTLSYISSVGVLSTLLASPIGRYFSKRRFFPEYTLCPTGEKPGDIIRLFGDEENTCPSQLPGYFYLLFLTGGSHLVISQPHYDIKLEFIYHVFSTLPLYSVCGYDKNQYEFVLLPVIKDFQGSQSFFCQYIEYAIE